MKIRTRIRTILYNALIVILFLSCTEKKTEKTNDSIFVHTELLDSTLHLNVPRNLYIIDSMLIIDDRGDKDIYQVCKVNKGTVTNQYRFGNIGEGPYEFIFNKPISKNGKDFHIFDVSLQRFYSIESSGMQQSDQLFNSMRTTFLKNAGSFHELIWLNDNLYFGNGTFQEGGMYAFYFNDSVITANIPYPDDKIKASEEQKGMVYQGRIVKQPDGDKFVFAGYYGHVLEVYKLYPSEKKIERIFSEIEEYPKYHPKLSRNTLEANFTPDNKIGFFTVSATHDYIYALYCGKIAGEPRIDYANLIYVYDWDGKLIRKYQMDKDVSGICVDSNNEWLYGLHTDEQDEEVKIIGFRVQDFL